MGADGILRARRCKHSDVNVTKIKDPRALENHLNRYLHVDLDIGLFIGLLRSVR